MVLTGNITYPCLKQQMCALGNPDDGWDLFCFCLKVSLLKNALVKLIALLLFSKLNYYSVCMLNLEIKKDMYFATDKSFLVLDHM